MSTLSDAVADMLVLLDVTLRQKTLMPWEKESLARLQRLAEQGKPPTERKVV
jgi:hypothetical protein